MIDASTHAPTFPVLAAAAARTQVRIIEPQYGDHNRSVSKVPSNTRPTPQRRYAYSPVTHDLGASGEGDGEKVRRVFARRFKPGYWFLFVPTGVGGARRDPAAGRRSGLGSLAGIIVLKASVSENRIPGIIVPGTFEHDKNARLEENPEPGKTNG